MRAKNGDGQPLAAIVVVLVCLIAAATAAEAQQRQLAYRIAGMDRVRRIADLEYRSLASSADTVKYGRSLRYDVFLPAERSEEPRAGVIFIHGGMVADTQRVSPKDDLPAYREWGTLVAAAGMVGITFSHRLTTDDNIDLADSDLEALLEAVRAHAREWNLDLGRICIAVFSAGGPLSGHFLQRDRDSVRCIVLYYPFLDVEHTAAISPFRRAHPPERTNALRRYSPRELLLASGGSVPPIFLARAGRDVVPGINASIDRFVQAALWVNAPLDLYIHQTGNHGFDMTAASDGRAEEIVRATIEFMRRHTQK